MSDRNVLRSMRDNHVEVNYWGLRRGQWNRRVQMSMSDNHVEVTEREKCVTDEGWHTALTYEAEQTSTRTRIQLRHWSRSQAAHWLAMFNNPCPPTSQMVGHIYQQHQLSTSTSRLTAVMEIYDFWFRTSSPTHWCLHSCLYTVVYLVLR